MNDHADDNELFKKLIQKPRIAWPTVMLLISAFGIFGMSTFAYIAGALPLGWAMLMNSIASYMAALFAVSVVIGVTITGWLQYYLLLFFLPTRIAKFFIIVAFDFLPHYPHEAYAKEEPYRCTSNRVGLEWLLTPLFIFQNYHLVHHLYPAIPFYRYLKIWNAKKQYHEAQNPAITDTFALRPR